MDFAVGPSEPVEVVFPDLEPRRLAVAADVLLPLRWIVCFPPCCLEVSGCFLDDVGVGTLFCGLDWCCCCNCCCCCN